MLLPCLNLFDGFPSSFDGSLKSLIWFSKHVAPFPPLHSNLQLPRVSVWFSNVPGIRYSRFIHRCPARAVLCDCLCHICRQHLAKLYAAYYKYGGCHIQLINTCEAHTVHHIVLPRYGGIRVYVTPPDYVYSHWTHGSPFSRTQFIVIPLSMSALQI